jgi:hypothetical protein
LGRWGIKPYEERLMKFSNLVLVAALSLGAIGVAAAQDAPAPPPGGGGRGALQAACGADIQSNCAGQAGRGIRQCLTENQSKISEGCKAALAAIPPGRGPGGGAPAPAGQ